MACKDEGDALQAILDSETSSGNSRGDVLASAERKMGTHANSQEDAHLPDILQRGCVEPPPLKKKKKKTTLTELVGRRYPLQKKTPGPPASAREKPPPKGQGRRFWGQLGTML